MNKCWVIGDACVDLLPENEFTYLKFAGGTGTNMAVCLAKLKVDCNLIAKIGDDPLAKFIVKQLDKHGVHTENVSISRTHRTTLIIVDIDRDGERSFTYLVDAGADTRLVEKDIPEFSQGDWFCISSVVLCRNPSRETCFKAIEKIKSVNGIVCVDANMRESMWDDPTLINSVTHKAFQLADVIKASEEEILNLTEKKSLDDAIEIVKKWPCQLAVITLAEKGSIAIFKNKVLFADAYNVPVVDMTGAGDAFMGAMISKLMKSDTLDNEGYILQTLKYANACGALVVGKMGAISSLPADFEINEFQSNYN